MMDEQGAVATVEQTPTERYEAFKAEQDQLAQRLAQIEGLTLEEVDEQVKLERLLQNRLPTLEHLAEESRTAKEDMDVVAFCAAIAATVDPKREEYRELYQHVVGIFACRDRIKARTRQQRDLCETCPPKTAAYLTRTWLKGEDEIIANLAQKLGPHWHNILSTWGEVRIPPPEQLWADDPGCKPLGERALENAINANRPLERSA
jgi:intracellular sulfur oxidation DsrE/DsrF family protein